jgi:hypothetical protein
MNYKEIRLKCNRFERIILDILYMWQFNRTYFLKEKGGEQFCVDELLEVIGEYALGHLKTGNFQYLRFIMLSGGLRKKD